MKTWFKFYGQEFLSDPKMLSLKPIEKALWLTILCLASSSDEEGVIKYITEEKIMMLTGIETKDDEWQENIGFLKKFEELSMVTVENNKIILLNFTKRQEQYLSNAERQARYRERHNDSNVTPRYESNARIEKKRIEYNNTGKSPEIKKSSTGINSVGDILRNKIHKEVAKAEEERNESIREVLVKGTYTGISTEWQEKAFRYAEKLGIKLDNGLKPRWLKVFKQASEGRKANNLETAYGYLVDHPQRHLFGPSGMTKMFFKIYENGLKNLSQ